MFDLACRLNRYALRLVQVAILVFILLGTLSSLKILHTSHGVAKLFEYLPLIIVGMSIPLTLMCAFLLQRLRVCDAKTILLIIVSAALLFLAGAYYGMAGWLGFVYVLKWRITGFASFLAEHPQTDEPTTLPFDVASDA